MMRASLLPLFLSFTLSVSLKTWCDKCDSDWLPVKNLDSALVGFDITQANVYAPRAIEDPGLRRALFKATVKKDSKKYRLEPGISLREYKMCEHEFKIRLVTTRQQLYKTAIRATSTKEGLDVALEVEGGNDVDIKSGDGKVPSVVNQVFRENEHFGTLAKFVEESKGALVIAEAYCIAYKMEVSHLLTPHFSDSLVSVLSQLEQLHTASASRRLRAFRQFVRDFGTHFISGAQVGAKAAIVNFLGGQQRIRADEGDVVSCFKRAAAIEYDAYDKDEDPVKEQAKKELCQQIGPLPEPGWAEFGAQPVKNVYDWSTQLAKEESVVTPVRMEFTPIVNLFTQANLDERYNISSAAILQWFLPLYLKFCKTMDMECNVDASSGCGIDDDCKFGQRCVDDAVSRGSYTCLDSTWADVANWPQMPSPSSKSTKNSTDSSSSSHLDPLSPNLSWFFAKDVDQSGTLSLSELWGLYSENNWFNERYQTALQAIVQAADTDSDDQISIDEYIGLFGRLPWFTEQLSFALMNTDGDAWVTRQEVLEVTRVSPDMHGIHLSEKQLEQLVDSLIELGDVATKDGKLDLAEYAAMVRDPLVDNFAPNVFKLLLRN